MHILKTSFFFFKDRQVTLFSRDYRLNSVTDTEYLKNSININLKFTKTHKKFALSADETISRGTGKAHGIAHRNQSILRTILEQKHESNIARADL